jgi:cell shape-determining protein MreD
MKPYVYFIVLVLIIPFQASLLSPVSIAGIKPDLPLAILFIIGLLTGPAEAALAGMGIGLVQDIGSVSLFGFSGLTRGLVGLAAGLLGSRVLDISNPMIILVLAVCSLGEGLLISLFLQTTYGAVPFCSMIGGRLIPQAIYTSVLFFLLLRLARQQNILRLLKRRDIRKEL